MWSHVYYQIADVLPSRGVFREWPRVARATPEIWLATPIYDWLYAQSEAGHPWCHPYQTFLDTPLHLQPLSYLWNERVSEHTEETQNDICVTYLLTGTGEQWPLRKGTWQTMKLRISPCISLKRACHIWNMKVVYSKGHYCNGRWKCYKCGSRFLTRMHWKREIYIHVLDISDESNHQTHMFRKETIISQIHHFK